MILEHLNLGFVIYLNLYLIHIFLDLKKKLMSFEGEENTEYTMCYCVEKNVNERLKKKYSWFSTT